MARVKSLMEAGLWLFRDPKDTKKNIFLDDNLTVLSGIGAVTQKKFYSAGILKTQDLIEADEDKLRKVIGITMVKMCELKEK